jgi:flagellar motor switch protein FliG
MEPAARERIVAAIQSMQPEVAQKIEDKLYDFEQLSKSGSTTLRALVTQIPKSDLALALKASSRHTKEALLEQLPAETRKEMSDRLAVPEAVTLAEIEAAQRRILDRFRFLRKSLQPPVEKPRTRRIISA